MQPLIALENITFSYNHGAHPLIENVNLTINEGDFVLIRGRSGSGKSTLLRLICRLQMFSQGALFFRGKPLDSIAPSELRKNLVYVAQIPSMIDGSVRENLLFPFSFAVNRCVKSPSDERLREMLAEFYLQGIDLEQQSKSLSVGEQQRVALMRALLLEPEALLFDEPTSALDESSAGKVFRIIEHFNRERKKTIVMVTHSSYTPEKVLSTLYTLENRTLKPA